MDLISRQAAIDEIRTMQTYKLFAGDDMLLVDQAEAMTNLMMMPTADLSEYCDKLWKTAYERGRKEASPIRCDECKYWNIEWIPTAGEGHYCPMMDHVMVGDQWCCYGERRTDG